MIDWLFPTAFSSWAPNDEGHEDRAYKRTYASGRLTMGPQVEAFEEEFANYHGRRHCIMVNSGSSANLVVVAAIKHPLVDKDILHDNDDDDPHSWAEHLARAPSIAWSTTYAPLLQHRIDLEIIDVTDTWNAAQTETKFTDMFVACSILGNPAPLATEQTRAKMVGGPLFEDNCEALGARTVHDRLTGTFGDLSTFSFFYSHQLSAIEGGAILTDDDDYAKLCRLLRNHGNEGWGKSELEDQYDFSLFGYNLRPLETHAAVAREQLKKLDEMVVERRANLAHFVSLTEDIVPIIHQKITPGAQPSPFGLAFECESREARGRLARALRANGVDCRLPTGGSFLAHKYGAPWRNQSTPRADKIHSRGIFLGNAPWPIPEKIELAVKVMKETL